MLQPQPDPDRDVSHGTITGEGMQLHCSHKQSCKSEMFEQGHMSDFTLFHHPRAAFCKRQITFPHPSNDAEEQPPGSGCP